MKILVVDDELVSRKMMQKIMDAFGECTVVESGRAALAAFEKTAENQETFDLITLDVSMSDMDGIEVLREIRKKENRDPKERRVRIMMVTSHMDKDTIVGCIKAGCDDYIVKPFDNETINNKLENLGIVEVDVQPTPLATKELIVEEIALRFKRGEIDLPPLPETTSKLREMIRQGASLQKVTELLIQDAAICSKLISLSNSPYYRGLKENKTLEHAISRLGLITTRQMVNAICNQDFYTTKTSNKKYVEYVEKLWEHSLACACASQIVSEALKLRMEDDAFTIGLLHDIGKLLLIEVLAELEGSGKFGRELNNEELISILDTLHSRFGAALIKRWGFSSAFVQIVTDHHNLEDADPVSTELLIVHFADSLVKSMGYTLSQQAETKVEDVESARLLKLDSHAITEIREKVEETMQGLEGAFL